MPTESGATSPTPSTLSTSSSNTSNAEKNGGNKLSTTSYDPTPYIQRARVTRPAPPKPSVNPLQFVQIKPCSLYQSAQEQLKKAEEVKKVKEIKKEEPEDWQSNLDNWKSSRRKRVEHIIDRVVEVKKLELEEHDRTRRKSKTFSEMLEERGSRRKLSTLAVYAEDESNDLSDLGIGTSSASGKSSLSEDCDNQSVMSDNVDTEKSVYDIDNNNLNNRNCSSSREYISSPGYDTSTSTAPTSSPDPCEYTYEGAIQDYKTRVSRAQTGNYYNNGFRSSGVSSPYSKDSTPERSTTTTTTTAVGNEHFTNHTRRLSGSKIEDRLMNFEMKSNTTNTTTTTTTIETNTNNENPVIKKDLPKVDILKRRELFEKDNTTTGSTISTVTTSSDAISSNNSNSQKRFSGDFSNTKSIRERLSSLEKNKTDEMMTQKKQNRLSSDITSIKDRLQNLEKSKPTTNGSNNGSGNDGIGVNEKSPKIDVPVVSLKDRLTSLQSAVMKEEIKKPVALVDEHDLEMMKREEIEKQNNLKREIFVEDENLNSSQEILNIQDESNVDTDREDSGIHTTDVSCSVSQTDEQPEMVNEDINHSHHHHDHDHDHLHHHHHHHHHINEDGLCTNNVVECIDEENTKITTIPDLVQGSVNIIEQTKLSINRRNLLDNDVIYDREKEQEQQEHHQQQQQQEQGIITSDSPEPPADQDTSVNEALELALQAIDRENTSSKIIENINATDQQYQHDRDQHPEQNLLNFENNFENLNSSASSSSSTKIITTTTITKTTTKNQITETFYDNLHHQQQQQQQNGIVNSTNNNNINNHNNNNKNINKNSSNNQKEDNNNSSSGEDEQPSEPAPINQTMAEITKSSEDEEPYYQVPKSSEPYYEVPKHTRPIPVYENIEIFYSGPTGSLNGINGGGFQPAMGIISNVQMLEPPKEKPPPPPVGELTDDEEDDSNNDALYEPIKQRTSSLNKMKSKQDIQSSLITMDPSMERPIKRMNSTKRIKKELRNKRSSFLGIEGNNDDDSFLELTVAPPPDMAQLLQEEKRLEKQLYMKAGLYESSDTGDSRDSGVSENHSRQSSEPFTTSSSEEHEDLLRKKEKEIIEVLEKEEEKQRTTENWSKRISGEGAIDEQHDTKIQNIEEQIREQEEVLRVEKELLQLEQEELKRQRENLIIRENMARRELENGVKILMSANRHSLQDINNASSTTNHYANVPNRIYQVDTDYRKSMSDLQDFQYPKRAPPPIPPAKPLRTQYSLDAKQNGGIIGRGGGGGGGVGITNGIGIGGSGGGLIKVATHHQNRLQHSQSTDDFVPVRNYQPVSALHHGGNMTRHTLHALSAAPKPKFQDGWVHSSRPAIEKPINDSWLKRKSVPEGFNYNKHWLIQEAEQRRIDQQRASLRNGGGGGLNGWGSTNAIHRNGSSDNKPLPDAIIQTLTQRVQSKGIGERKKLETSSSESTISTTPTSPSKMNSTGMNTTLPDGQQEKILSVSGKKKCSHCGEELGRGAAMIIESLRLFYHINCFKCCVCHVQLGDGLNGTDVRVRNHKLHCHNCYSSDDGIKFSCV